MNTGKIYFLLLAISSLFVTTQPPSEEQIF